MRMYQKFLLEWQMIPSNEVDRFDLQYKVSAKPEHVEKICSVIFEVLRSRLIPSVEFNITLSHSDDRKFTTVLVNWTKAGNTFLKLKSALAHHFDDQYELLYAAKYIH